MTEKQQLDAELSEILKHLPGWQLDPKYANHTWCAMLIDSTGRGIHINIARAQGRLYIGGTWPRDNNHWQYRPDKPLHITIARNQPPEKIAAEIERRFLPWYLAAYAEQLKQVKQPNATHNRQQKVTVKLAAWLESLVALLEPKVASHRIHGNPSQIHAPGLTVDIHNGGENVTIQLRYKSIKVAKAVLKAFVKAGGLSE